MKSPRGALLGGPVRRDYTIRDTNIYRPADARVLPAGGDLWYSRSIKTLVRNDLVRR